jgi:hypothetical protein
LLLLSAASFGSPEATFHCQGVRISKHASTWTGTIMVDLGKVLGNGFKMAQFLSASILCAIWHLLAAIHDNGGGLTLWLMTWIRLVITTLILVEVLSMCSRVSSAIMKIYTSLLLSIYTNLISSCSFSLSATAAKPEEEIVCS